MEYLRLLCVKNTTTKIVSALQGNLTKEEHDLIKSFSIDIDSKAPSEIDDSEKLFLEKLRDIKQINEKILNEEELKFLKKCDQYTFSDVTTSYDAGKNKKIKNIFDEALKYDGNDAYPHITRYEENKVDILHYYFDVIFGKPFYLGKLLGRKHAAELIFNSKKHSDLPTNYKIIEKLKEIIKTKQLDIKKLEEENSKITREKDTSEHMYDVLFKSAPAKSQELEILRLTNNEYKKKLDDCNKKVNELRKEMQTMLTTVTTGLNVNQN